MLLTLEQLMAPSRHVIFYFAALNLIVEPVLSPLWEYPEGRWIYRRADWIYSKGQYFRSLKQLDDSWRKWAGTAISQEEIAVRFKFFALTCDLNVFDSIRQWLNGGEIDQVPNWLVEAVKNDDDKLAIPVPRLWRKRAADIYRKRVTDMHHSRSFTLRSLLIEVLLVSEKTRLHLIPQAKIARHLPTRL
jgi:hypothetical protein